MSRVRVISERRNTVTSEKMLDLDKKHTENMEKLQVDIVEYDDILSSAGEIGPFQIRLFFSTFPFYVYGVFVYLSQLFMTEVSPNHWCWIPELQNLTDIERRTLAIPPDANNRFGYSRCRAYDANWTEVLTSGITPNATWSTIACQNGWEFNKTEIPYPTISSEMGWVCEKDHYQATAQAFYFLGSVVGCLPIGWIADKYGRVYAATLSNLIAFAGGVSSVFVTDFYQFIVCRFIMGLAGERCMLIIYLLVLENVAPKYRTMISNMSFALFFSMSAMIIPWVAYGCADWKTFGLATSVPMILVVIAPFIIPESPRWLMSRGRLDEAIQKIITIGQVNKKIVPPNLIEQFKYNELNKKAEEEKNFIELFKTPGLRKMIICMCMVYMCCTIMFDSLVRSTGSLGFNFFVSFTLMSFTELPALVIMTLILDHLGRRFVATTALTLGCVFSIISAFVSDGIPTVVCVLIARFSANIAYATSELWSPEMMPTSVRASASAFVNIAGYASMILAPYIVYLENYVYWLPFVLVGCVSCIGALLTLALPETAKKTMPQTFEDAQEMLKSNVLWSVPFLERRKIEKNAKVNEAFAI